MAGALTAAIAAAFSGGAAAATDPYFEYTTLLLPGSGTNGAQNNTFLDGSTNNFTITRNGNTTQGTFSPFSQTGWGNYFDGTGDYLTVADNTALEVPTQDFTIEAWVYLTSLPSSGAGYTVIQKGRTGTSDFEYSFEIENNAGNMRLVCRTSSNGTSLTTANGNTISLATNTWYHVAVTRTTTTASFWFEGVAAGSGTVNSTTYTGAATVGLFANNAGSSPLFGYASNFRLVKGVAVYTGAFTPPTSPLAATQSAGTNISAITGTQTSLLTCQSNRFIDNSTANSGSGFTITVNGNTSVVAFSPFNPTASWSAATNGGSGYFDGSGDYLSFTPGSSFAFGTGDFTVEAWFYPTQARAGGIVSPASNGSYWDLLINSNNGIQYQDAAGITNKLVTANNVFTLFAWNHIALVRNSGTSVIYVNGVSVGSVADTVNYTATINYAVGRTSDGAFTLGYFNSVRVIKGTAVYTAAFTPPTAPLTAITNTSLLLNFTNAGVYDATSKNDLETVGNAQISTTQSKWGGSSISFDGTGDWLLIPDQPPQRIGTGNFTVEMWVYRNSSGTYGLAGKGTGTTGWLVSLNSSNQVVFTYGSSTITSSGTVSATTWTHIAVVREGTSTNQTKIYIGGSNDGTGTVSTDFNQTNSMYIGADRTGGSAANAYVQDLRITNYARYTANFPAPTAAFPTL